MNADAPRGRPLVDAHAHWGLCFQQRDGLDPSKWLAVLDRHGVTHAVILPFSGLIDAGKIVQENEDIAAVCAASGGRMVPFCTINTWFQEESLAELERCLTRLGYRGVKFHPWLQGQAPNSAAMDAVCEMAAAHDVPILFHDGTPPFSLPSQIAILARRHPKTTIILGHCGLLEHWREAIASMRYAANLWGCMCSPHPAALRQILRQCDVERLVWGSDFGFNFFDFFEYRLGMMRELGMTPAVWEKVFETNPARLLGLDYAATLTEANAARSASLSPVLGGEG